MASLAHDIRTPLTGILALAELLSASELGERERRWALGVKSAADHLARLTSIVCDAVKADAAGLTLQEEPFSPRALAESVSASLVARAQISRLKTEIVIASDLPPLVRGDPVRLRAMIENLIDNAVKFTARGGIRLAVSAQPLPRDRVRLVVAVTDSGIGMTAAELKRLFRPFTQASESVSRRYGGTGLGLSLVSRLARAMGGSLAVESKPKLGSTFTLKVVVSAGRGKAPASGPPPGSARAADARSLAVLCVEDNPFGRVVLNTIMSELGHRTEFAGSGEAAIAAIGRRPFDLVIMDIELSDMDGLEATRRIRALDPPAGRVPIVGVSGKSGADIAGRARAAGMNEFLEKPIDLERLVAALGRAMSG